jgi:hypothetical protein
MPVADIHRSKATTLSQSSPNVTIQGTLPGIGFAGTYHAFYPGLQNFTVALFAPAGTDFTIDNEGFIDDPRTSALQAGILLGSPGTVLNNGTIIGGSGIVMLGTGGAGDVLNNNFIAAKKLGIYLAGPGAVTNAGTITGGGLLIADSGIDLANGGVVTNTGSISNFARGIVLYGTAAGYIDNSGSITSVYDGINMSSGSVTNTGVVSAEQTGISLAQGNVYNYGTVSATPGRYHEYAQAIAVKSGDVYNSGQIYGYSGVGVGGEGSTASGVYNYRTGTISAVGVAVDLGENAHFYNAGLIVNLRVSNYDLPAVRMQREDSLYNIGTVIGAVNAIEAYGDSSDTLSNRGLIETLGTSQRDAGVKLNGGRLSNLGGGVIKGYFGVVDYGVATIRNAGTITAPDIGIYLTDGGTIIDNGKIDAFIAIDFHSLFKGQPLPSNELILMPHAQLSGYIEMGGGILDLAPGKSGATGTISLATVLNASNVTVDSTAIWNLAGTYTAAANLTITNAGTIIESSHDALTISGSLLGAGTIELGAQPLALNGSVSAQHIQFTATGQTLDLGDPAGFAGKITNFAPGDTIDLTGVTFASITGTSFADGVLTISQAAHAYTITFATPVTFANETFALFAGGTGTGITLASGPRMAFLTPNSPAPASENPAFTPALYPAAEAEALPKAEAHAGWFATDFLKPAASDILPKLTLHA